MKANGGAADRKDPEKPEKAAKYFLTRMDTELQCIAADEDARGEEFPFRLALSEGDRICVRDGMIYVNGAAYTPASLNDKHHFRMRIAESGSRIRIALSRITETEYLTAVSPEEAAAADMPSLEADAAQAAAEVTAPEPAEKAAPEPAEQKPAQSPAGQPQGGPSRKKKKHR